MAVGGVARDPRRLAGVSDRPGGAQSAPGTAAHSRLAAREPSDCAESGRPSGGTNGTARCAARVLRPFSSAPQVDDAYVEIHIFYSGACRISARRAHSSQSRLSQSKIPRRHTRAGPPQWRALLVPGMGNGQVRHRAEFADEARGSRCTISARVPTLVSTAARHRARGQGVAPRTAERGAAQTRTDPWLQSAATAART